MSRRVYVDLEEVFGQVEEVSKDVAEIQVPRAEQSHVIG
jgi:hypothetical protein